MQVKKLKNLVKECVTEVLFENLSISTGKRLIQEVYPALEKIRFVKTGREPREYMEYYLSGFATVYCGIFLQENVIQIQRYYDSERLDMMKGYHIEKQIPIPAEYSPEFSSKIIQYCKQLKDSVSRDETIFGGMDDIDEGFRKSFGTCETIYKQREGGRYVYWIDNRDSGGKIFINPDNLSKYIRQGYKIIDISDP